MSSNNCNRNQSNCGSNDNCQSLLCLGLAGAAGIAALKYLKPADAQFIAAGTSTIIATPLLPPTPTTPAYSATNNTPFAPTLTAVNPSLCSDVILSPSAPNTLIFSKSGNYVFTFSAASLYFIVTQPASVNNIVILSTPKIYLTINGINSIEIASPRYILPTALNTVTDPNPGSIIGGPVNIKAGDQVVITISIYNQLVPQTVAVSITNTITNFGVLVHKL